MILTNFFGACTVRIPRIPVDAPADRLMVGCLTLSVRAAQAWAWVDAFLLGAAGLNLRTVGTGDTFGTTSSEWVTLGVSWPTFAGGDTIFLNAVCVCSAR